MAYILADSRAENTKKALLGEDVGDYFSSNYEVSLNRPINKVVGIELLHGEIPNSFTVIKDWNDLLIFFDNNSTAAEVQSVLTPGYYTPDEFINMVNGVMTDDGTSTFSSTYDANTNKYTIESTTNSRFLLFSEAIADASVSQSEYERYFRAAYLMGIDGSDTGSLDTSYEMDYPTDLRGVRYYTVNVELNSYGNQAIMTTSGNVSFLIPVDNNSLIGFTKYNSNTDFRVVNSISKVNVDSVRIKVFWEDSTRENEDIPYDTLFLFKIYKEGENNF